MGQSPVTFLRQVLGLVVNPEGLKDPSIPADAKERANAILGGCKVNLIYCGRLLNSLVGLLAIKIQILPFQIWCLISYHFREKLYIWFYRYLQGSSVGSYSDSAGLEVIRRHVADYIQNRDGGVPSNWENIVLCAGASEGIRVRNKYLK